MKYVIFEGILQYAIKKTCSETKLWKETCLSNEFSEVEQKQRRCSCAGEVQYNLWVWYKEKMSAVIHLVACVLDD